MSRWTNTRKAFRITWQMDSPVMDAIQQEIKAAEERAERLRAALVKIAESGCECMPVSWSDGGDADDPGICLAHQANDALMFDDERIAKRGDQ